MCPLINRYSHNYPSRNEPHDPECSLHFKEVCIAVNTGYFGNEYLVMAGMFSKITRTGKTGIR